MRNYIISDDSILSLALKGRELFCRENDDLFQKMKIPYRLVSINPSELSQLSVYNMRIGHDARKEYFMHRLNVFNPFEDKSPKHEDTLTRAFMILLRLSPVIHADFLEYVRDKQRISGAENIIGSMSNLGAHQERIFTQVGTLKNIDNSDSEIAEHLLSIVITNNTPSEEVLNAEIKWSKRVPRYDGVVCYGHDWVIIIENKPYDNVDIDQLNPSEGSFYFDTETAEKHMKVEPKVVSILWRNLVNRINNLVDIGAIYGAESIIVDDFLNYMYENHTGLNPYTSFSICRDRQELLDRRCSSILRDIEKVINNKSYVFLGNQKGWKECLILSGGAARRIALSSSNEGKIVLEIYPGDNVEQARLFYQKLDVENLVKLKADGWQMNQNLHFTHIQRVLMRSDIDNKINDNSMNSYLSFWKTNLSLIRQVSRSEFEECIRVLVDNNILDDHDYEKLNASIENPNIDHLRICPGLALWYTWDISYCIENDKGTNFVTEVVERIRQVLSIWQQEFK